MRIYYQHSFVEDENHTMKYSLELLESVLHWAFIDFPNMGKGTEFL